ncbi:hypothetical protein JS530_05540 [Bifidobacterium sp. LC6]|uniref:Uncharacterized protein n=1 Tax=Bifidobacterium colobi TaxID=2809026 RepID=A0ABS5UW27_9BIFI|nr:hypothetical protein [Bifidobacterium colobi]
MGGTLRGFGRAAAGLDAAENGAGVVDGDFDVDAAAAAVDAATADDAAVAIGTRDC